MSATTCINHPERTAVEHCEVCGSPLCAYCLYYTSDGQRLCKTHADQAEAAGAFVRSPEVYAGGLIPAQVDASRQPAGRPGALYEGNAADVIALVGLLIAAISLTACIPGLSCLLGPVGLIISLVALFMSRDARNRARTRLMAGIGIGLSALWAIIVIACFSTYFVPLVTFTTNLSSGTMVYGPVAVTVQFQLPPGRQPAPVNSPYPSPTMAPTPVQPQHPDGGQPTLSGPPYPSPTMVPTRGISATPALGR
jgi:hypothetical protein